MKELTEETIELAKKLSVASVVDIEDTLTELFSIDYNIIPPHEARLVKRFAMMMEEILEEHEISINNI